VDSVAVLCYEAVPIVEQQCLLSHKQSSWKVEKTSESQSPSSLPMDCFNQEVHGFDVAVLLPHLLDLAVFLDITKEDPFFCFFYLPLSLINSLTNLFTKKKFSGKKHRLLHQLINLPLTPME